MRIDTYLTPFSTDNDMIFSNSFVVMIDVLRASSTICAALQNGAKEIIVSESVDKAIQIFSELSKEHRFLGGERNGIKPSGFDAGNSPSDYSTELVKGKTVILSTTNGTKLFHKAANSIKRVIGGFVNLHVLLDYLNNFIRNNEDSKNSLVFLCAGTNGRLSYEDTLCAGAFIHSLLEQNKGLELSDTALVSKELYSLHAENLHISLMNGSHVEYLKGIGFEQDLEKCFIMDIYPVIPVISGSIIKLVNSE